MELRELKVAASPAGDDSVRVSGLVSYDRPDLPDEWYWFEVPARVAHGVTGSGNAWLACLAPVAATLREDLRIGVPVNGVLLANIRELLRVWTAWYPNLPMVEVEAQATADPPSGNRAVASFFSGGVDAFFTVLRHAAGLGTPTNVEIADLLFIAGYDIAIENRRAIEHVETRLRTAAQQLGKQLVRVTTNIRETQFGAADWEYLSHGAALAAVGLLLEGAYEKILIGSSAGYRDLRFWGSHPLTDPLFSTAHTDVIHDGPAFMRVEKTEYVARFDVALQTLRVCWKSETGENCGACNNCYRTMLALDALGVLDRCPTFPADSVDLERAAKVYCPNSWDVRQFGYIRELAERRGRPDIVRAVDRTLAGSRRLTGRLRRARALWDRPIVNHAAGWLERRLLRDWIT